MPRKGNSGRKKGATSCIRVSLKELRALLSDDATVMVNKRWAEQVGVGFKSEPVSMEGERVYATTQNVVADSAQVDVQVSNLADEEPVGNVEIKSHNLDSIIDLSGYTVHNKYHLFEENIVIFIFFIFCFGKAIFYFSYRFI